MPSAAAPRAVKQFVTTRPGLQCFGTCGARRIGPYCPSSSSFASALELASQSKVLGSKTLTVVVMPPSQVAKYLSAGMTPGEQCWSGLIRQFLATSTPLSAACMPDCRNARLPEISVATSTDLTSAMAARIVATRTRRATISTAPRWRARCRKDEGSRRFNSVAPRSGFAPGRWTVPSCSGSVASRCPSR